MDSVFEIGVSKNFEEVDDETDTLEVLSRSLILTMPSIVHLVILDMIRIWSSGDYDEKGFTISVSKLALSTYGTKNTILRKKKMDVIMNPLVELGYLSFFGKKKTAPGIDLSRRVHWEYLYKVVSKKVAIKIAIGAANALFETSRKKSLDSHYITLRQRRFFVGLICDRNSSYQMRPIRKKIDSITMGKSKVVSILSIQKADSAALGGGYFDAIYLIGSEEYSKNIYMERIEYAKKGGFEKRELMFQKEDEFLSHIESKVSDTKRRKKK